MQKTAIDHAGSCPDGGLILKLKRVMRITAVLLLAASFHVAAKTQGQNVTLRGTNIPIKEVFQQIHKQTGLEVLIDEQILEKTSSVSLDVHNMPVADVLAICLRNQPLIYTIEDGQIIIKSTAEDKSTALAFQPPGTSPPPVDIHGRVTDSLGNPLAGASVSVKGSASFAITDSKGEFTLSLISPNATIVVTYVGYEKKEFRLNGRKEVSVILMVGNKSLEGIEVKYSSGYQTLPRERATGSYDFLDNQLINRRISTDILSRIDGVASGVIFNKSGYQSSFEKTGISIRGISTLEINVSADPLIVLDNFIYAGDLNNINPNDVENITILKDATAASIWGAKSGNGVIVITTKKGKYNQQPKVEFSCNWTVGERPDLGYYRGFLDANDYIGVEKLLYNNGYYEGDLTNPFKPPLSPAVEILAAESAGKISPADADAQLNTLKTYDVRNDFSKYVYQKKFNQQYYINVRGGSEKIFYLFSAGYDNNKDNLIRNGYNRISLKSSLTFIPVKNLEIRGAITYSQSNTALNNANGFGTLSTGGGHSTSIYPYARFADNKGNPLSIVKDYNTGYVDSMQTLGFQDWHYRPIDEIANGDNNSKLADILLNLNVKYNITPYLNVELLYQNDKQIVGVRQYLNPNTYYVRNYVNRFSVLNSPGNIQYNFPLGGILQQTNNSLTYNDLRGVLNFSKSFKDAGRLDAAGGTEIQGTNTSVYNTTSLGYNDEYGTAASSLDYATFFPINPYGYQQLPGPDGTVQGTDFRFLSWFATGSYTYKNKYILSGSIRQDGANVFGVKTNDRLIPLWSVGLGWEISKENFYQINWLPNLKARATFGYNGNVYNGSAYLTARFQQNNIAGSPVAVILGAPNPNLQWEKIQNINFGIDFSTRNNILTGTIEYYHKNGMDLVEGVPSPPSAGVSYYVGNNATSKTEGLDLTLNSMNINRKIKWTSAFLSSFITDKVTRFDNPQPSANAEAAYLILGSSIAGPVPNAGKPLYGLYSYKWAGLDPTTGDPMGYLNGKPSKQYDSIINGVTPNDLVFNGRVRPSVYGSLMNTVSYKAFSLSFNITYRFGYVFRKTTTSLNYTDIVSSAGANVDYIKRWQKPGDEKTTSVPSLVYPDDYSRNQFYQSSSGLIDKADNIKLQDINLSYTLKLKRNSGQSFSDIQVSLYAYNLGILWKANKDGVDPDAQISISPIPRTYSFGIKANF